MQVFMPWPGFEASARATDTRRLQKGIVEAYQILRTALGESEGWKSHPAVKMWAAHPGPLAGCAIEMAVVWRERGGGTSKAVDGILELERRHCLDIQAAKPWAAHSRAFCLSHQLNLARKRPELYGRLFKMTAAEVELAMTEPYLWPVAPGVYQVGTRGTGRLFQPAFGGTMTHGALTVSSREAEERYQRDLPELCQRYDRYYGREAVLAEDARSLEKELLADLGIIGAKPQ